MKVGCKNPADYVLVDVHLECQGDLLSDSLATPSAIAPFHFNNRLLSTVSPVLWDLAAELASVKTTGGTSASRAFCENSEELKSLARSLNERHEPAA